ncbi:hypothetical protein EJ04DRAFT_517344, partial [Polyplosphaeria fusca]
MDYSNTNTELGTQGYKQVNVLLNTAEDWELWMGLRQQVAVSKGIWKFVNPESTDDFNKLYPEVALPFIGDYALKEKEKRYRAKEAQAQAEPGSQASTSTVAEDTPFGYQHLTIDKLALYQAAQKDAKESREVRSVLEQSLSSFSTDILTTVSQNNLRMIINKPTPREKLATLKARYYRGTYQHQTSLALKYEDLKKRPRCANL